MARVLIVDDEPEVLETLADIIAAKHEVVSTTDSMEAYRLLKDQKFDLLLTDIRMPGMNGFMLARAARQANPNIRIVIISAYYEEGSALSRSITGRYGDCVISKPVPAAHLEKAVDDALKA